MVFLSLIYINLRFCHLKFGVCSVRCIWSVTKTRRRRWQRGWVKWQRGMSEYT